MCILCSAKNPNDLLAGLDQHEVLAARGTAARFTLDQIANQLTSGYWGGTEYKFALDGSRTLTYNVSGLSTAERNIAVAALEAWTEVSGITFVATTSTSGADIVFDNSDPDGAYAFSNYSGTTLTKSYVNIPGDWATLNLNGYMLQTYMHEIGHALGLGHAGNYNGSATFGVDNLYDNDSWLATVMSYFDQIDNTLVPGSFAWISTLMPADIIAIQNLYGFSGATNAGNSNYGANSNIGGYLQNLLNQWTGTTASTADTYVGQPIAFTIYDSDGTDTIDFSSFNQSQEISLVELAYSNIGGLVDNVTIARGVVIENATGGGGNDTLIGNDVGNYLRGNNGNDGVNGNLGQDTLAGDAGIDTLYGGSGNDTLFGGSGDDQLDGGIGNDRMEGGDGNDTYQVDSAADVLFETTGGGTDTVVTALTSVTLSSNVEILLLTSGLSSSATGSDTDNTITAGAGSDTLTGLGGIDVLYGGAGNDSLYGGSGDDQIYGSTGNDRMEGGTGNDTFFVNSGADVVVEAAGAGTDTVRTALKTFTLMADVENLVLTSTSNSIGTGNALGNTLTAGLGADTLFGLDGFDFIYGGAGNDSLSGGNDIDNIYGGDGNDSADGGAGADWLYGALGNDTLLGGTEDDRLLGEGGNDRLDGGDGNDVLTGGIGNDLLIGRNGDDFLYGGDGADRLFGFAGSDRYEGGLGADQFVMNIRDEQDVFVDFQSGVDKVLIGRAGLGIAAGTTLAAMWQTGGALPTTFSGSAPVLYYDSTSRVLFLDTDGGSSSNATGLFGLQAGGTLILSDLLIA